MTWSVNLHSYQGCSVIFYQKGTVIIQPTFTVVICTRDRPEELDRCLASVRSLDYPYFDILVVDSAPRDFPALEAARRWGARYLFEQVAGVSRARNSGAIACDSDIVAILDDDAIADPGWLLGLAMEFQDAGVIAVAGRIKNFEAYTDEQCLCASLGDIDHGDERRVVDSSTPHWFELACFGGIGNGANLAFRRKAFDLWPGFSESLGTGTWIIGGEEHYAFFTLIELGYRVVYAPDAVVSHPFPKTLRELRVRQFRYRCSSICYIAFLFSHQSPYRIRILKYVVEALRGERRAWRRNAALESSREPSIGLTKS